MSRTSWAEALASGSVIIILAVAAALALPACAPRRGRLNFAVREAAADYHVAVILYPTNPLEPKPNACEVTVVPTYLLVGRKDKLTFDIVNLCGNTETIEVKDFVGLFNPANQDPLDKDQGGEDPKKKLLFKVKALAAYDIYKYKVYRAGIVALDPEIDVDR